MMQKILITGSKGHHPELIVNVAAQYGESLLKAVRAI